MAQARWPSISTSVSGISPEDWDLFKAKARRDKVQYGTALEQAIADLATAARRGDDVDWQPVKIAPSKGIRIHADTWNEVNKLVEEFGYKQNVVFATALHMWTIKP